MQFEQFRGRDVAEALAQVRAAYGANALIGSTRVITNGKPGGLNQSFVEVTAAAGTAAAPSQTPFSKDIARAVSSAASSRSASSTASRTPAPSRVTASRPVAAALAPAESEVGAELRALRALVEELATQHKPKDRVTAMLNALGLEGEVATELASKAPRGKTGGAALRTWVRGEVHGRIRTLPSPIEQPGLRLIACVGPTGVGKTTTLAKLAARAYLELGRSVAIISLDTFRVGAVEQMKRFAQLIGLPFETAQDASAFARAVAASREDIVLVDTPSRAPADMASLKRLVECLRGVTGREVDVLLTIPASIRSRDAERVAECYQDCGITGVCITKLDETDQIGGALHGALAHGTPLAYLCAGPRVPEDLEDASADSITERLIPSEH